ncbi:hypothetical protein [Rhodoferax sp.]|uniref:hypothetical protein n=1 Tax=Rhodoferax sp. TaxID=50421 RepID=UPI002617B315|nr:hypothetical protein [Rhodoferax sp.]
MPIKPTVNSLVERVGCGLTTEQDAAALRCALYSLNCAVDQLPAEGAPSPMDAVTAQVERLLELCFRSEK